jgi:hypothetical protein
VVDYATEGPLLGLAGPRVRHLGVVDQADEPDGRVVMFGPPDLPPPAPGPDGPRIAWDVDNNVVTLPPVDAAQVTYAS